MKAVIDASVEDTIDDTKILPAPFWNSFSLE